MRIPQAFIDDLLTRIDIVEFIGSKITLKKAGANYTACCPFHNEKTPSFSVSPSKQFFYCFGCGAHGSAIGFQMQYENQNFPQAVEAVANTLNIPMPTTRDQAFERGLSPLFDVLAAAKDYYAACLKNHAISKSAVDYLKNRGLTGQVAKQFQMGFAPPAWEKCLEHLRAKGFKQQDIQAAGLVVVSEKGKVYDRFRNRVMFPIQDQKGRTIAFGGRVLNDDKPKYLNSPETKVFHKQNVLYGYYEACKAGGSLDSFLVVEGYMDVVALRTAGITNAVAALGTAITASHCRMLLRRAKQIVFCLDGDAAGRKAAWRALEICLPLMEEGRSVHFLFLPEGEDPDSFVKQHGVDVFHERLQRATSISEYFYEQLEKQVDLSAMEGKSSLIALAMPYFAKMQQNIFRHMLMQMLSGKTGVALADLQRYQSQNDKRDIEQKIKQQQAKQPPRRPFVRTQHSVLSPVERAISLLLQQHELVETHQEKIEALLEYENPQLAIFKSLVEVIAAHPGANLGALLAHWQDSEHSQLLAYLASRNWALNAELLANEFADSLDKIRLQFAQAKKNALLERLAKQDFTKLSKQDRQELEAILKEDVVKNE